MVLMNEKNDRSGSNKVRTHFGLDKNTFIKISDTHRDEFLSLPADETTKQMFEYLCGERLVFIYPLDSSSSQIDS